MVLYTCKLIEMGLSKICNKCKTYLDSVDRTLVFSVDKVLSYKVVDRRGIIPLGPTVRFPLEGSYLDDESRGLAGLVTAAV